MTLRFATLLAAWFALGCTQIGRASYRERV